VHGDPLSWLDERCPETGEHNGTAVLDQIEVTGFDVRTEDLNVRESLFDHLLNALPSFALLEWEGEDTTNSILELDWLDCRSQIHEKDDEVSITLLLSTNGNTSSGTRVKSLGFVDSSADLFLVGRVKRHVLIP